MPAVRKATRLHIIGRGSDAVWLGVWEHNPRAISFYRKFGFVEAGEQTFHPGRDPQRDIVMVRNGRHSTPYSSDPGNNNRSQQTPT
jgi:ribosomal protein S18 acetylase RimI-like enzyme